ncbi:hypothetical protein DPMN_107811 [Dreissena polymorpha]|uniref:Uncharacterized protein n=1 Tax=Dreissena polymorpha TaxID=45954 RepID=A0A9D4K7L2_DREPO|nr:hypothetical protein DPMN_107811 [Dreissena polymorpha]
MANNHDSAKVELDRSAEGLCCRDCYRKLIPESERFWKGVSVQRRIAEATLPGISLIHVYRRKSRGPTKGPEGTPDMKGAGDEVLNVRSLFLKFGVTIAFY